MAYRKRQLAFSLDGLNENENIKGRKCPRKVCVYARQT